MKTLTDDHMMTIHDLLHLKDLLINYHKIFSVTIIIFH